MLVIANPSWSAPALRHRLWCLYELLLAAELRKPLEYQGAGLVQALSSKPHGYVAAGGRATAGSLEQAGPRIKAWRHTASFAQVW